MLCEVERRGLEVMVSTRTRLAYSEHSVIEFEAHGSLAKDSNLASPSCCSSWKSKLARRLQVVYEVNPAS